MRDLIFASVKAESPSRESIRSSLFILDLHQVPAAWDVDRNVIDRRR